MSNPPKVTFGNKSVSAYNTSQLPPFQSNLPFINQYDERGNGSVQNTANQVVSGQPSQFVAPSPPPYYQYRSTSDPRISSNQYRSVAQTVTVPQTTLVKEVPRINEEIERPQYSNIAHNSQPSKKLGPDQDPKVTEGGICSPCCWILGALIGLGLLALALLFGLGVIGGSNNSGSAVAPASITSPTVTDPTKTASVAPVPATTSTSTSPSTTTTTTTTTPTSPSTATTTTTTPSTSSNTTSPSGSTGTNTYPPTSTTPTGTTSVQPIPYVSPTSSTTTTATTTSPTTQPAVTPGSIAPTTVEPVVVQPIPVASSA